jgi:radical SAM protein with 4Fe4S-binding SPASM domain
MDYLTLQNQLIKQSKKLNVPLIGEFEITPHCNLKCKMCYVREEQVTNELSTADWLKIIKGAQQAGLFYMLLTGGEIFLHPDFKQIYEYAYDLGIRIILFTNGTLINEDNINILKDRPPLYVAITLYGASNKTYQLVTGNANGFDLAKHGIEILKQNNINILLRTIALKETYDEIDEIISFAKTENLPMKYSLYVGPRRSGCKKIERLSPHEVIAFGLKHEQAFGKNLDECQPRHLDCPAGKNTYFISWDGYMMGCAMMDYQKVKVNPDDFRQTWDSFRSQTIPACEECIACTYQNACIACPAKRYLEGDIKNCSKYLKDIAQIKHNM